MQKLKFINSNGKEIDFTSGNFGITNWKGLSESGLDIQTQKVPFQDGSVFLDALIQDRTIDIVVAVNDEGDLKKRYELKRQIISVLNPKLNEGVLIYENDYLKKQINAIAELPIFSNKNMNTSGTMKVNISFNCPSPYWEDIEETTVEVPLSEMTAIVNDGDVDTPVKIEIESTNEESRLSFPKITNFSDSKNSLMYREYLELKKKLEISTYPGNKTVVLKNSALWNKINLDLSEDFTDIIFENNVWIVVGKNNLILRSTDGLNWELKTELSEDDVTKNFYDIVYGKGLFVTVRKDNTIFYSKDNGETWNTVELTVERGSLISPTRLFVLPQLDYVNGKFIVKFTSYYEHYADYSYGIDGIGNYFFMSNDGVNWDFVKLQYHPNYFWGKLNYINDTHKYSHHKRNILNLNGKNYIGTGKGFGIREYDENFESSKLIKTKSNFGSSGGSSDFFVFKNRFFAFNAPFTIVESAGNTNLIMWELINWNIDSENMNRNFPETELREIYNFGNLLKSEGFTDEELRNFEIIQSFTFDDKLILASRTRVFLTSDLINWEVVYRTDANFEIASYINSHQVYVYDTFVDRIFFSKICGDENHILIRLKNKASSRYSTPYILSLDGGLTWKEYNEYYIDSEHVNAFKLTPVSISYNSHKKLFEFFIINGSQLINTSINSGKLCYYYSSDGINWNVYEINKFMVSDLKMYRIGFPIYNKDYDVYIFGFNYISTSTNTYIAMYDPTSKTISLTGIPYTEFGIPNVTMVDGEFYDSNNFFCDMYQSVDDYRYVLLTGNVYNVKLTLPTTGTTINYDFIKLFNINNSHCYKIKFYNNKFFTGTYTLKDNPSSYPIIDLDGNSSFIVSSINTNEITAKYPHQRNIFPNWNPVDSSYKKLIGTLGVIMKLYTNNKIILVMTYGEFDYAGKNNSSLDTSKMEDYQLYAFDMNFENMTPVYQKFNKDNYPINMIYKNDKFYVFCKDGKVIYSENGYDWEETKIVDNEVFITSENSFDDTIVVGDNGAMYTTHAVDENAISKMQGDMSLSLKPGTNEIQFSAESGEGTCKITFKNRFIGV